MATTKVWATVRVQGFHCWPEAPSSFAFLQARHRHEFHATVRVVVDESRGVEFIDLKQSVLAAFEATWPSAPEGGLEFGSCSCEQIASALIKRLRRYGYPVCGASVSEDGENGADVEVSL